VKPVAPVNILCKKTSLNIKELRPKHVTNVHFPVVISLQVICPRTTPYQCFLICYFSRRGLLRPSPKPQARVLPLVRRQRLPIQYILNYPSHPQTAASIRNQPYCEDRITTYNSTYHIHKESRESDKGICLVPKREYQF